jgi:hypothetical protein
MPRGHAELVHFEHEAIVSIAIRNYPLEHWNQECMFYAVGPFANP